MAEPLLGFKAGRAFRRAGTNFIDIDSTKGAILLATGEDGLLHFNWKNRTTNEVEEDLILFPSDATFTKVHQATTGRVYVLKFSSSDQRHFFWMQDASSDRDDEFVRNMNGLLEDPDFITTWNADASGSSQAQASTSTSSTQADSIASNFQATPEQLSQLEALIQSAAGGGHAVAAEQSPELSLTDILTPTNLTPLFSSHPELIPSLFPHLPPDLPVPPSAEVLNQIINSPQFRASVMSFDQALRTGMLGGLVRGLGLPEEAGTGILPFLRAVQEQADRERGGTRDEGMDTD